MNGIVTKAGDGGTTRSFDGRSVSKTDLVIASNGAVDELNCVLGVVLAFMPEGGDYEVFRRQLSSIQRLLFNLGYSISAAGVSGEHIAMNMFFEGTAVKTLEAWLDDIEEQLPPISKFVIPGGHKVAALLHQARAVCRRAERAVVKLHSKLEVDTSTLPFLNRLSDYLFVLARFVNVMTDNENVYTMQTEEMLK